MLELSINIDIFARSGEEAVRTRSVRTGENIRLNRDFHETPVAFELSMNSRNNKNAPKW